MKNCNISMTLGGNNLIIHCENKKILLGIFNTIKKSIEDCSK